jgi:hypothetical protein
MCFWMLRLSVVYINGNDSNPIFQVVLQLFIHQPFVVLHRIVEEVKRRPEYSSTGLLYFLKSANHQLASSWRGSAVLVWIYGLGLFGTQRHKVWRWRNGGMMQERSGSPIIAALIQCFVWVEKLDNRLKLVLKCGGGQRVPNLFAKIYVSGLLFIKRREVEHQSELLQLKENWKDEWYFMEEGFNQCTLLMERLSFSCPDTGADQFHALNPCTNHAIHPAPLVPLNESRFQPGVVMYLNKLQRLLLYTFQTESNHTHGSLRSSGQYNHPLLTVLTLTRCSPR